MTKQEFLFTEGKKLLANGLNAMVTDNYKKPVHLWTHFQEDLVSEESLLKQSQHVRAEGLAVICGKISGDLEVIDFDIKNDLTGDLWNNYINLIPDKLYKKLLIVSTKSSGYHIYYRCETIAGNQKLASRPATEEEKKQTPHLKQVTLIETRGEGGYVIAPPTAGYSIEQANEIPVISVEERNLLLDTARRFHEVHLEVPARFAPTGVDFVLSPFDDYNSKADAVATLTKYGWTVEHEDKERIYLKRAGNSTARYSGNYHKEKKLFMVWSTSTQFEPEKAYSPAAVFTMLEYNGDFSAAAKALIKQGFGTLATPETRAKAMGTPFEVEFKFWKPYINKHGETKAEINLNALTSYLSYHGGFFQYKYSEESENIIIQVQDGFVRVASMYDIKQFLKNNVLSFPSLFDGGLTPDELIETVYREYLSYLSKGFMDFLPVGNFDFLKDTPNAAYFPFRNGIVEVTKSDIKLHSYGEFKKVVWAAQLIDKDIEVMPEIATKTQEEVQYYNFLYKVAGNDEKFNYFMTIVGYLLHKFKDPKRSFAVILAEESENEADGGGTGKGIFAKAIKQLIPTEIFDGKTFTPSKAFAFQRVSLDTKMIFIDDTRRGFKFEELYSHITEGIPVEKKGLKEFYIPFSDSPKILISTNYVIKDEGNHAKRRQKVLEFTNYFSPAHTPFDEFGCMLFDEWEREEWLRFYNFMFYCTSTYLEFGVAKTDQSLSNKVKNIRLTYGEDLLLYFHGLDKSSDEFLPFKDCYSDFLSSYDIHSKDYTKKHFASGIAYIASVLGYRYDSIRKRIDNKVQVAIRVKDTVSSQQLKIA